MKRNMKIFYFLLLSIYGLQALAERSVKIENKTDKTLLVAFCPEGHSLKIKEILTVEVPPSETRIYTSEIEGIELGKKGRIHFEIPGTEELNSQEAHYVKMPLGSYRKAVRRLLKGEEQTFRVFTVPVLWQSNAPYRLSRGKTKEIEVTPGTEDGSYEIKIR